MFCIAYPLRREGVKLRKEDVPAGARRGWLTFARMPAGQPVWTARLTTASGASILPDLDCASVKHIERGIMVQGLERRGAASMGHVRQAWWCVPDPDVAGDVSPAVVPKAGRRADVAQTRPG